MSCHDISQNQYQKVTSGFHSLSSSPSELYKTYILKFLDSYSYFSFALIFTLFLSDEFGMGDVEAGTIYGAWGALITVFGLFTGTIIDNLGVAKCLRIGFVLSFVSRVVIFTTTSKATLMFSLLVTLPFSNCLGIPVLTVGIRRYTTNENRGFAFGLFYVVMNIGALIAGPLVDALTVYYNDKETEDGIADLDKDSTTSTWAMTSNRAILLSGIMANFIAIFVAFSIREIKVDENTKDDGSPKPHTVNNNSINKNISNFTPEKGSPYQIISETIREPNFRRFLLVCLLTLNVRMVFRHLDGTLPKYMIREFGADTPKGKVYAINPFLIIIMVPIITAATTSVDPLVMIHYGTYVSALSVFFLAIWTSIPSCVLFVITLSIGEAIWSPRLYDYTMSVAQEGREGTYMALSSAPLFLAKLPVGFLSGILLQRYCPEHIDEGEVRHSKTMWLIIGLSTIVSPILITILWGYISGPGDATKASTLSGRNEVAAEDTNSSENSYQHKPLKHQISLPRVRSQEERPLL